MRVELQRTIDGKRPFITAKLGLRFGLPDLHFPGSSAGKETICKAEDLGSIPESGRSPIEGKANPLQYCCLGNSMDRGAWRATVHEVGHDLATKPSPPPRCWFTIKNAKLKNRWGQRESF